jgi:DNA repair protein RecN (Recombination protein N)
VRDLVVVREATLEFGPGLNVVSGETGAGKSLLLGAVGLVAGERGSTSLVRPGARVTRVEAVFAPRHVARVNACLAAAGLDPMEEEWLIVRRELTTDGKSRAFVGDQQVLVSTLRELGEILVDVHGQGEGQLLRAPRRQLVWLDAVAGVDPAAPLQELLARQREITEEIDAIRRRREEVASQRDLLEHELREIADARLEPGEEEALGRERELILKAADVGAHLRAVSDALVDAEGAALDDVGRASTHLEALAAIDPELMPSVQLLENARAEIEEVARAVARRFEAIDFSPERRDEVELRLDVIQRLRRRYGGGVEELLSRAEEIRRSLQSDEESDAEVASLEERRGAVRGEAAAAADRLGEARARAARRLARAVTRELPDLGMKGARFEVQLTTTPDPDSWFSRDGQGVRLGPAGAESVAFMLSANPGHPLAPVARAASGGELSRVMLALKSQMAEQVRAEVMIFDEVDAGVGGRTARAVGERIGAIARKRQVIAITHLAPVACLGDRHFRVEKRSAKGKTSVRVRLLGEEERIEEIASMLSGADGDQVAREHARELLADLGGGRRH